MTANAYWIPEGADFDPYAPKLSDIYNAIKQPVYKKHVPGEWDWAPKLRQWEEFAKRDSYQDFRPYKVTLGFDTADRTERTYAAPLNFFEYDNAITQREYFDFFNYKEHSMATIEQAKANNLKQSLGHVTEYLGHMFDIPEAQIGITNGQQGKHPWTAMVGTSSISYKSSPENHLRLALEHLVAAQTVPTLVAAWEDREARNAEEAKAKFTQMLHQPNYLDVLSAYNETCPNYLQYNSWREFQKSADCNDAELLDFIERQRVKQTQAQKDAEAEKAYRAKRREELAAKFSGYWSYENVSASAQKAIDHIIGMEIKDGDTK